MTNVAVVSTEDGDWNGLYVNGQLVVEGHTLHYRDVLESVVPKVDYYTVKNDYLEIKHGATMPQDIQDIAESDTKYVTKR